MIAHVLWRVFGPPSKLDLEIDRVRKALHRHEAEVDRMRDEWSDARGACCPSCMFGRAYSDAAEQCSRTRKWLVILLRKRGREEDLREAASREYDG